MSAVVAVRQNDHVRFELRADGSFAWQDAEGRRWESGRVALQEEGPIDVGHVWNRSERSICEQFPGRFRVAPEGDGFRVTVLGRFGEDLGTFLLAVTLDGPWIEFAIDTIDEALPSLVYPPPVQCESLVVPRGVGEWIRRPLASRYFWTPFNHLNMRFFGGLRGDAGWLAVWKSGLADSGVMATRLALSPGWLKSLDRWSTEPRRIRYRSVSGDYNAIAKVFRTWSAEHGLLKTLSEKREEDPRVGALVGGRLLSFMLARPVRPGNFEDRLEPVPPGLAERDGEVDVLVTYAQARAAIEAAEAEGLRGIANLRGWIAGGYDAFHPDIWPPEPALGRPEELAALTQRQGAFLTALHDNYQDIYARSPSFPQGVIQDPAGRLMAGGLWAGGQCYILNAAEGRRYRARNWAQLGPLEMPAFFPDTVTAVHLYEDRTNGRTQTRAQDLEEKIGLLADVRAQGCLLGSEEAADFGVPLVHWFENRHARRPGESIPLWPLVFGDTAMHVRYRHGATMAETGSPALTEALWGYARLIGFPDGFPEHGTPSLSQQVAADRWLDAWHAEVAERERVRHQYLDDAGMVERMEFAGGRAVTVNFGPDTWEGYAPLEPVFER